MTRLARGFTLIELIVVIILLGILSVSLSTRFSNTDVTSVQTSRDDIIAALFFAQQTAMARDGIQVAISGNTIDVTENGNSISVHSDAYPLVLSAGVTATPETFIFNKLGKTTPGEITVSRGGVSTIIRVESTGYAHD